MRNNKLICYSIGILVLWFSFSLLLYLRDYNSFKEKLNVHYLQCIETNSDKCDDYKSLLDNYSLPATPELYNNIISYGPYMDCLSIITIIFVAIPCIYNFYLEVKDDSFRIKILKEGYYKYIKRHYLNSLKSLIILPLFFLITFFITCIVTNFNFYDYNTLSETINTSKMYLTSRWKEYYITILFAIFTHGWFYINLTYIAFYKIKNFLYNMIMTFFMYIVSQVIIIYLLQIILSRLFGVRNPSVIYSLEDPIIMKFGIDVKEFKYIIISSVFYIIISFIIFYLLYRKKERFVKFNEKKN